LRPIKVGVWRIKVAIDANIWVLGLKALISLWFMVFGEGNCTKCIICSRFVKKYDVEGT
jgi:hypothetical protein